MTKTQNPAASAKQSAVTEKPGDTTALPAATVLDNETVSKMYTTAKRYIDTSYRNYWDKYFRIYKRQRVDRHYEGISDPVIPEVFDIIEALVAEIAGGDISFHFKRTSEEQTENTDVLNSLLEWWLECNHMNLRNQEWVREMLQYGTGILEVTWVDGMPSIANIPIRDFFFNPQATSMSDCTYAGYVYLGNLEMMKQEKKYDAASDKMVAKYTGLDNVGPATPADAKQMDKQFKDQFNGSTLPVNEAPLQQVFVIRMYDLTSGKLVEMANNKQIIYQEDIPYQREEQTRTIPVPDQTNPGKTIDMPQKIDAIPAFIPFAPLRDYIDTSLFLGEGEIAIIADRGEDLNDYEAMDIDNTAYQNTPMYQIDPQFTDLATEIETIPGAVYPIPKGAISAMPIAEIAGNLDEKKDRIIAQMRGATGADEVLAPPGGPSRTTATEVVDNSATSQNRFSTKIGNLQDEGYARLGTILYWMGQIFLTEKTPVPMNTPNGTTFQDYDPWVYSGIWTPHTELQTTTNKRLLEMGQKDNQIFQILSNDPDGIFNPVEIKRWEMQHIDPTLTDEAFNKLLAPPAPPGPTVEQQKLSADVRKAELGAIGLAYRYFDPYIQAQADVFMGFQPDPMMEVKVQQQAMKMGAEQADMIAPGQPTQPGTPSSSGVPSSGVQPPAPTPAKVPAGLAA